MNGILNVYKEKGPTSHDVVDKIRHILNVKKAGHAGTLDPGAEGVLPVCLGKATKLSSLISDSGKTYRAVMLLGVTTDTQDTTGKTLSVQPVNLTEDEVKAAAISFVGPYEQITPMYSARKVGGKKLYELARAGEEVERKPRRVEIESLSVDETDLPRVTMTVSCSRGTYIRTLCHDIGQKLGCGACMESLCRTRVGRFRAEDGLTVSRIEELQERGLLDAFILPVDELFSEDPALSAMAGTAGDKLLHNGNPVPRSCVAPCGPSGYMPEDARMYDSSGEFIGIYRYEADRGEYVPVRMLF